MVTQAGGDWAIMKDAPGSTVAEHMQTPNGHQQGNSVLPIPTVVMSGLALLAAFILAFARATLTAEDHLHIAARLDAYVHTAMFLGGVGMFIAISFAIARLVGARVLEYAADRRRVAEKLSEEHRRNRKRDKVLRATADTLQEEWDDAPLAPLPASTVLYRRSSSSPSPRAEPSSLSSAQQ